MSINIFFSKPAADISTNHALIYYELLNFIFSCSFAWVFYVLAMALAHA